MQGERTRPASAIVLILDSGYEDSNLAMRLVDRVARHLVEAADEELRG